MKETEQRNPDTVGIDRMTTQEMLNAMQMENERCTKEVGKVLPSLEKAVDLIYPRLKKGGRLFYVGCGISGRIGVLDASECPPTFGVPESMVTGIIAGGDRALRHAVERAEDDAEKGQSDLAAFRLNHNDCVVGLSASGEAAYVIAALKYARETGCVTVAVTSVKDSLICTGADVSVTPDTGAEVVTGSTRLKAGTAQKLILNMLSTSVMIKLGYVCENMMINLKPSNLKLRRRCVDITSAICGCDAAVAELFLRKTDWNIRAAVTEYKKEKSL